MNGSQALATIRLTRVHGRPAALPAPRGGGFSIIDVLVSIAVIAVLISILMPSLTLVRETTRRLVCASNSRQIGLGVAMYAEDYGGVLPPSSFAGPNEAHKMMTVRTESGPQSHWDGLGWLIGMNYLDTPAILYCPSHKGTHSFATYADQWREDSGLIFANYHYRGRAPSRTFLTLFSEPNVAVVADGMRTQDDFNHKIGANVLRIDLSVSWFADSAGRLVASLPTGQEGDMVASRNVGQAWELLDASPSGGTAAGTGW